MSDAGKLPLHLQKKEDKLHTALANLRSAYDVAIASEQQLHDTLQRAKQLLDENKY